MDSVLGSIERVVGDRQVPTGRAHSVLLRRTYDATVEDVWSACTDPERLRRWFLPVSGDLRLGGGYQLEGNAGGTILRCEPPNLLKVTWVLGEPKETDFSEVELRLHPARDGGTLLELEHAAVVDPGFWDQYGPGAVGVGWDLTLLGLALHLAGEVIEDHTAWEVSPEGRRVATQSSEAWGAAYRASGATPEAVAAAVEHTTAFYAPPQSPG
jgi:uncharacterized protein YndB with AHSA1/START domain